MREMANKAAVFCCCFALLQPKGIQPAVVLVMLAAVFCSALLGIFRRDAWRALALAGYCAGGVWLPELLLFLPLLAYDAAGIKRPVYCMVPAFFTLVGFLLHGDAIGGDRCILLLVLGVISVLLCVRTRAMLVQKERYRRLEDSAKEDSLHMAQRTKALMEKQDYEVRLATLNERNRIAREIHDNVGHQLTSSILQLGALQVVNRDPAVDDGLQTLKATLSGAMDSVRSSVHNLHDDAVNLRAQLESAVRDFNFCPVQLRFEAKEQELDVNRKYCIIAVVREALSNIARHSNATQAQIRLTAYPAFYQLVIQDNGRAAPAGHGGRGIGMQNMRERVAAFSGTFHTSYDHGFRLFITIPKEDADETRTY